MMERINNREKGSIENYGENISFWKRRYRKMIERIKNIDKLDIEQLWSKGKIEKKEV